MSWTKRIDNSYLLSEIPQQESNSGFISERHSHYINLFNQGKVSDYTYVDNEQYRVYTFFSEDQATVDDYIQFDAYLFAKYNYYHNIVVSDVT
jgi:hypothetical protein